MKRDKKFKQTFIKIILLIFFLNIFPPFNAYGQNNSSNESEPRAVNGVIDLSDFTENTYKNIKLDGQWEFYWNELFTPEELDKPREKSYISIPGSWNSFEVDGEPIGGDGYATFRLTIKLPEDAGALALKLPSIYTAHKLWVNGELVSEEGEVGQSKEEARARHYRKVVPIQPENGEVVLVFQVSNFMHRMGGIWQPILIGDYNTIKNNYDMSTVSDAFLFGILFVLGFFYMAFYFIRRREKSALYFGIFALIMSFRIISVGNILIVRFFETIPQEAVLRLEYMTFYGGMVAYTGFVYSMFPKEASKKVWFVVGVVTLIETLVVLFTSPSFFSRILYIYQIFAVILLAYLVFIIIKAAVRGKKEAWLVMISGVIFFGTAVNDMLFYNEKINTGNLYPLGLLALVFTQALLLLKRFTNAFSTVEILNTKLIEKDKLKDEFLDDVAHGILTPTNGMVGIAEALYDGKDGGLNEAQKSNLELIISNGRRLGNLVKDIQDFSRLKNRDIELKMDNLDLNYVSESVMAICRTLVDNSKVELVNEISPNEFYIKADETRIYQIFFNLVENAIKYTTSGKVGISATKKGKDVEVTVYDTGIGIPKDKLHTIFEPYVQVSEGQNIGYGGFGLGLFITKNLIELHGGRIKVHSEEGKGTKFVFSFPGGEKPIESKDNLHLTTANHLNSHWAQNKEMEQDKTYRILVVDDEAVNRQVLESHLTHEGYTVHTLASGGEALSLIKGGKGYDLIILDIMMPEMTGFEVCQEVRKIHTLSELPILVISVKNRTEDIIKILELGANDYLSRSFDKKELLARVKTLIMMRKSVREALEAQIGFLQAQIKPHFLYNALNSIMGLCIDQPEKAYNLLGEFSNYLRGKFGLKSMDSPISLGKEIDFIKSYMSIEKARFGDKLEFELNIEAGQNLLIPPLILQPLVENAVKHGIYPKPDGGKVVISAKTEEKETIISVEDNGIGMSRERITAILTGSSSGQGIGLKNVDERLKLYYGQGLIIESSPGKGTKIYLKIPDYLP
ncbi:MAG: hypothetical protein VR72_20470 [Clostridiaceae bacterium BRH_c20a]|nr:MAG: hypothetical protein VR72_20470 [Clostridiaceae bacterium BRH_c20a]